VTDQPEGPQLPPLESNDPDWRAARWRDRARKTAAGSGRHWTDPARPVVRSSSAALRRYESPRVRLDVVCRRRLLARVLGTDTPGVYDVAYEAAPTASKGGWGVQSDALGDVGAVILVACRCSARMHHLDPMKLRAQAWEGRPGKPHEVGVSDVILASG